MLTKIALNSMLSDDLLNLGSNVWGFSLTLRSIPLFEKACPERGRREGRGEILLDQRGENPPASPFWQRGIKCVGAIPKKFIWTRLSETPLWKRGERGDLFIELSGPYTSRLYRAPGCHTRRSNQYHRQPIDAHFPVLRVFSAKVTHRLAVFGTARQ